MTKVQNTTSGVPRKHVDNDDKVPAEPAKPVAKVSLQYVILTIHKHHSIIYKNCGTHRVGHY